MTLTREDNDIPKIIRRNLFQQKHGMHFDLEDVLNDSDLMEKIIYLYDIGITVKMIKGAYSDIENERGEDNRTVTESIEGREYY
ncbi:hypothetical protein NSQ91_14005 [Paenibacillus sp. FSL R7-0048]|nr:hypothetical protein [Paenibacillus odorifer]OMD69175.1 hypothetical protein BSK48_17005 [Paenibacillus odorifer]OME29362.1 hypothetical protein BSK63_21675 [Paenibacillus odorifer]